MNDKRELTVRTWLTEDFKVIQEIGDPVSEMTRKIANVAASQAAEKIQEGLVALGWVPPEKAKRMIEISEVLWYMSMTKPEPSTDQVFNWLLEKQG